MNLFVEILSITIVCYLFSCISCWIINFKEKTKVEKYNEVIWLLCWLLGVIGAGCGASGVGIVVRVVRGDDEWLWYWVGICVGWLS